MPACAASGSIAPAIELMTDADLPEVGRLAMAAFPAEGDPTRRLREELARSWARVWVARDAKGGRVIGYQVAWLVAEEVHLLNVAVDPDARRRGVGRALVEEFLRLGRAQGSALALLEVRRSNAGAIALYERLGFETLRIRAAYYGNGEDALEMGLSLDPAPEPNTAPPAKEAPRSP
jgi:ribosomal-protein-alanine N-acetyltransferase